MGELLICSYPVASMPYYLENSSKNIYSLEELCYCMEKDSFLLETDIRNEDFCLWLENEFGEKTLSANLRRLIQRKAPFSAFAEAVMGSCDYFDTTEKQQVLEEIRKLQQLTPLQRGKLCADRLFQRRKYGRALRAYEALLAREEECLNDPVTAGNIWHNLGVLYATDFLYEEAATAFESAYRENGSADSLLACLTAYLLAGKEEKLHMVEKTYDILPEQTENLREQIQKAGETETNRLDVDGQEEKRLQKEYQMCWEDAPFLNSEHKLL